MKLSTPFLFVSMLSLLCFGVCSAVICRLNNADPYKVAYTITVDQSGHGNFTKVQQAIDSIPTNNNHWIRIHILPGVYREKVTIPADKPCILLEGNTRKLTTISYDDHTTLEQSATFTSLPGNIVAKDITFKNSYNRGPSINPNDRNRTQAVAARIYGDKCAFHRCGFEGLQDTLWDVTGRHYFNSCYIEGAVDFIFGSGRSIYERCSINVTAEDLQANGYEGYITAQGRNSTIDRGGFVIKQSTIKGAGKAYLGRAYGALSRVIISNCYLSEIVDPKGWDAWSYVGHEIHLTYTEKNNYGPGSSTSNRVKWMTNLGTEVIHHFTNRSYIDSEGWLEGQP